MSSNLINDEIKLERIITHEFIKAESAFNGLLVMLHKIKSTNNGRPIKEKISVYFCYVSFIAHLYNFYHAYFKRSHKDFSETHQEMMNKLLVFEAEKYRKSAIELIDAGQREKYGLYAKNYYTEEVPPDFGEKFFEIRNLNFESDVHPKDSDAVSEFYQKYQKYVQFLYRFSKDSWGPKDYNLLHLKDIERLSKIILS